MWKWNVTKVNNRKIHWGICNSQCIYATDVPILLFVHGAASKGEHWLQTAECLSPKYCTLIIDRPGYGKSETNDCMSMEDLADLIVEWLNVIGVQKPVIFVGHSMGGAIGLTSVLKYAKHFKALVLVATFVRFKVNQECMAEIDAVHSSRLRAGFSKDTFEYVIKKFITDVQNCNIKAIQMDFSICDGWDFRNKLQQIKIPTLILAPMEDQVVAYRQAKCLKNGLQFSTLKNIVKAGHNVLLEQPEEIAQNIDLFINEISCS